jgi:hypothetical protein
MSNDLTLSSETMGSLPLRDIVDDIEDTMNHEYMNERTFGIENKEDSHDESVTALRQKYMLNLLNDNGDET